MTSLAALERELRAARVPSCEWCGRVIHHPKPGRRYCTRRHKEYASKRRREARVTP